MSILVIFTIIYVNVYCERRCIHCAFISNILELNDNTVVLFYFFYFTFKTFIFVVLQKTLSTSFCERNRFSVIKQHVHNSGESEINEME